MATVKRYSSFEEMDEAQVKDQTQKKSTKPKSSSSSRNVFKEFGERLRKGMLPPKKK